MYKGKVPKLMGVLNQVLFRRRRRHDFKAP